MTKHTDRLTIEQLMNEMPEEWKEFWCSSDACCCLGCANRSGNLEVNGYTKQDWEQYIENQQDATL